MLLQGLGSEDYPTFFQASIYLIAASSKQPLKNQKGPPAPSSILYPGYPKKIPQHGKLLWTIPQRLCNPRENWSDFEFLQKQKQERRLLFAGPGYRHKTHTHTHSMHRHT